MAEGTYEHACMRAELLGLDKPDEQEFYRHNPPPQDEKLQAAQFEDISLQNEEFQNVSGGLSELNSILSGTQRKLNRIKGVYGSLADLLKNKLSGSKDNMSYSTDPSYIPIDKPGSSEESPIVNKNEETKPESQVLGVDLNRQISSQVDKLDSMLTKAENAQYSMDHQNKQMKKFLKK